jgi:hypothetical protein
VQIKKVLECPSGENLPVWHTFAIALSAVRLMPSSWCVRNDVVMKRRAAGFPASHMSPRPEIAMDRTASSG